MLNWYVPFFVALYVIRTEDDVLFLLRLIAFCVFFVAVAGVAEFFGHHRYFVDVIPKPLLNSLMASNVTFAAFVESSPYRNGVWRSLSIFMTPLSLGEFGGMMAPLGIFYLVHGRGVGTRLLGLTVITACLATIGASGSRGGYLDFIAATGFFVVLWAVRTRHINRGSLAPALVALISFIGFGVFFTLVLTWGRLHNIVLGGYRERSSDQSRYDQLVAAWPHILANPITGHGIGTGGDVIGYFSPGSSFPTVDSYVLSLLVENGVPGFLFFFGIIAFSVWVGGRQYVSGPGRLTALSGCIACSLVGFGVNRLVLSQRESHTIFFILVACIIILSNLKGGSQESKRLSDFESEA